MRKIFERILLSTNGFTLLPVVFCLLGAIVLFIIASYDIGKVLEVHSLDQLKDKLGKVIIMVLIVNFFQRVLHASFSTPLEMIYLALSILALCLGLYFLHKGEESH